MTLRHESSIFQIFRIRVLRPLKVYDVWQSGIGDTQLTADVRYRRPQFGLLQGKDNLLFGES